MCPDTLTESRWTVALLAEGVDRNAMPPVVVSGACLSPSSRRAWIEILAADPLCIAEIVALLAEGVDRNTVIDNRCAAQKPSPSLRRAWIEIPGICWATALPSRRPPCGGRG